MFINYPSEELPVTLNGEQRNINPLLPRAVSCSRPLARSQPNAQHQQRSTILPHCSTGIHTMVCATDLCEAARLLAAAACGSTRGLSRAASSRSAPLREG